MREREREREREPRDIYTGVEFGRQNKAVR
jgi:hypothetical protein